MLSLSKNSNKIKTSKPTPKLRTNNISSKEEFFNIADFVLNFNRKQVCNLTLDELLDKIGNEGIDSLSEVEKQKLDEYSKTI